MTTFNRLDRRIELELRLDFQGTARVVDTWPNGGSFLIGLEDANRALLPLIAPSVISGLYRIVYINYTKTHLKEYLSLN